MTLLLGALGGVVVLTLVFALVAGWRPGGRTRPNEEAVRAEVRRELGLPDRDWRTVVRSVRRGHAAPEPLRPAAYELARRLEEHRAAAPGADRPALLAIPAVLAGLGLGALYWFSGEDDPLWFRALRLLPALVLTLGIPWGLLRHRTRTRSALDANRSS